jgi:predicted kinase
VAATVILLAGLPGAGKTTIARRVETERSAVRFTLDEWMLRLFDLRFDDPEYAARVGPCQDLVWDTALQVLQGGNDVILDWNQWSRSRRTTWRDRAHAAGFDLLLYFVDVPIDVAIARAEQRTEAWAHDIDADGVRHLASIFEPPNAAEGIAIVRVPS